MSEALVHQFAYWDQHVQTGMWYGTELYTLFKSYSINERLTACDVACEYKAKGTGVCITASKTTYSVWLNLRSLSTASDSAASESPVQ